MKAQQIICMINENTYEVVNTYDSIEEASKDTLASADDIYVSLATGIAVDGFIWNRRFIQTQNTSKRNFSRKKTVVQLDLDGAIVGVFESVNQATKQTGISNIDKAARGLIHLAGGYVWKYEK